MSTICISYSHLGKETDDNGEIGDVLASKDSNALILGVLPTYPFLMAFPAVLKKCCLSHMDDPRGGPRRCFRPIFYDIFGGCAARLGALGPREATTFPLCTTHRTPAFPDPQPCPEKLTCKHATNKPGVSMLRASIFIGRTWWPAARMLCP